MLLTYSCFTAILENLTFLKRKQLNLACPSIRKCEENYPYRLESVHIQGSESGSTLVLLDSVRAKFVKINKIVECFYSLRDDSERFRVAISNCSEIEAAEKYALYHLNRPGTTIRNMQFESSSTCILKCAPLTIRNLRVLNCSSEAPEEYKSWVPTKSAVPCLETNYVIRDDTISNAKSVFYNDDFAGIDSVNIPPILIEWNCFKLNVSLKITLEGILNYCKSILGKTRPMGSSFTCLVEYRNLECVNLDWLALHLKGKKTWWNGRKCATVYIDEKTELNIHGNMDDWSEKIVIEVNARGTAIDR